jgi:hypothetical protein
MGESFYHAFTSFLSISMYIIIPFIIVYKIFKKKKLPNNEYTPYDDILLGRTRREGYTKEIIQSDQKHEIKYEEILKAVNNNAEKEK